METPERRREIGGAPDDDPFASIRHEVADARHVPGDDGDARGHRLQERPLTLLRSGGSEEEDIHRVVELGQSLLLVARPEIPVGRSQGCGVRLERRPKLSLSHVKEYRVSSKRLRRLDGFAMAATRGDLPDGADDEGSFGHPERAKTFFGSRARSKPLSIDDRRMHRAGLAQASGDRAVGERKRVGASKDGARKNVAGECARVVEGAREENVRAPHGRRRDEVVMGEVAVDDVEALAEKSVLEESDVPPDAERSPVARQERPRPSERREPSGERRVADEAELRFHAGRDERRSLIEHDRCRAGPFLAGDELEDAHEKKLSAVDFGSMAVDPELLAILVCPKTKGPLELVDLNDETRRALVEKYREKFRDEEPVVTQGLYSKTADLVYPIVSDIPVMLIDEALPGSAGVRRDT